MKYFVKVTLTMAVEANTIEYAEEAVDRAMNFQEFRTRGIEVETVTRHIERHWHHDESRGLTPTQE